ECLWPRMAATVADKLPSCWVSKEDRKVSRNGDLLWKEFFRDPSKWWDNRYNKPSPRHSDFKHKTTGQRLWMGSSNNPSWVQQELRNRGFTGGVSDGTLTSALVDSFIASLRSCARNKDLVRGTNIHHNLVQMQLLEECSDALVTMYAKCGELGKAKALFDMHKSKDVITWTALIGGYARAGQGQSALDCLEQMQHQGLLPDAITYVSALKACAVLKNVDKGKQIHDEIARQGFLHNSMVLGGALVDMYAKCGAVSEAQQVLEELPSRNVVSWNALIAGYAQEGDTMQALTCLEEMEHEGISPNAVTYICTLKACALTKSADKGKKIHHEIVRQGLLQNDIVLGNALVDMYAKCGITLEAQRVLEGLPFRDIVSWNALITGFAQEGEAEKALDCLEQMRHDGIPPDAVTYVCALKACATIRALDRGKKIHNDIAEQGLLQNNVVLGNALVDMYAKCGDVSEARRVLKELTFLDVVSWNVLIGGYTQGNEAEQALNCFEEMQHEGMSPDGVTYACALKACATIKAVDKGKQVHQEVVRRGLLHNDVVLGNALVDMYAQCGHVSNARQVLEELPYRDVVSWNALIAGHGHEGEAEQALHCLEQMEQEGILPDAVSCACVLNVCSHRGLVEEGQAVFLKMGTKYDVKPSLETYTCMIDLFGRVGHVEKAVKLIQEMPSVEHKAVWHALMGVCWKWADANVGEWAFEQAMKLDKSDSSTFILMANIYAAAGMEEKAKSIEAMRIRNESRGLRGIDLSNAPC
ncbi:hypothetical protein GOP47_0003429, partial [Adiantum capillus-veneris]